MCWKLSRAEFNALTDTVKAIIPKMPNEDLNDKLLICMMQRLMIELEQRRVVVQPSYKLNWHPERKLAFATVCSWVTWDPSTFHGNLILKLYNQILQEIA